MSNTIPPWRMLVYPANGGTPTVINRDNSFIQGSGMRFQIALGGDCVEASFNAKGAGIKLPCLSTVQFQWDRYNNGNWTNFFYGEVRQGGNPNDIHGENYILRSLAQRFKEVTLSPSFTTPQQAAEITVAAMIQDVIASGQLGSPALVTYDASLIQTLGFDCRAIINTNSQTFAAFLDQLVQDGQAMGVDVAYGVNADGKFFCTRTSLSLNATTTYSQSIKRSDILDLKWRSPIAETPVTAVKWFICRKPDNSWLTYTSVSEKAQIYGIRIHPVSLSTSINPWISMADKSTYRVIINGQSDQATNVAAFSNGYSSTDYTAGNYISAIGVNPGDTVEVQLEPPKNLARYVVNAFAVVRETNLTTKLNWNNIKVYRTYIDAQGNQHVYTGPTGILSTPQGINPYSPPINPMTEYIYSSANEYVAVAPKRSIGSEILSLSHTGKDEAGKPITVEIHIAEMRAEGVDTKMLDNLATYYYDTPEAIPAEISNSRV